MTENSVGAGWLNELGIVAPQYNIEVALVFNRLACCRPFFPSRIYFCSCPKLNCGGMANWRILVGKENA